MRMIKVNIFNTKNTIQQSIDSGAKKYFCVSTDKAANPVNMMGASKRIMEMFMMQKSDQINISTARFANVAFSDGSLLKGFNMRIEKNQPLVAPNDVKRYFLLPKESGQLCLMSCIFGENRDIYFPKLSEALHLVSFADIAKRYLEKKGYEAHICETEKEARELVKSLPSKGKWPCLFSKSDTTGEKDFEEFFTKLEILDMNRFKSIGIIKNEFKNYDKLICHFEEKINALESNNIWSKNEIINLFNKMIPNFNHKDTGKYLDSKM